MRTLLCYGKTSTRGPGAYTNGLPPAGTASPIVSGGLVLQAYFNPSGGVIDEAWKKKDASDKYTIQPNRYCVAADDCLLALDATTGKLAWHFKAEGKGLSLPMGKRGGWGYTPAAHGKRVYMVGTTGRVYCLELATGKLLWESTVGTEHEQIEQLKKESLAAKKTASLKGASCYFGQALALDDMAILPDMNRGLIAFDGATGKKLWEITASRTMKPLTSGFNMPAVAQLKGKNYLLTVNGGGELRLLDPANGKIFWTQLLGAFHLTHPVASGDMAVVFTAHPKFKTVDALNSAYSKSPAPAEGKKGKADDEAEEGGDVAADVPTGVSEVGSLAGYRLTEQGAQRVWQMPAELLHVLKPDAGPHLRVSVRDNLVYYITNPTGVAMNADPNLRRLVIADLPTGKIRQSVPMTDPPMGLFYLFGDRVFPVTNITHRPRSANAEIWQSWDADPDHFCKLGEQWHINPGGDKNVHTGVGSYIVPLREAAADGLLYFRTIGGLRCYDLRAESYR